MVNCLFCFLCPMSLSFAPQLCEVAAVSLKKIESEVIIAMPYIVGLPGVLYYGVLVLCIFHFLAPAALPG